MLETKTVPEEQSVELPPIHDPSICRACKDNTAVVKITSNTGLPDSLTTDFNRKKRCKRFEHDWQPVGKIQTRYGVANHERCAKCEHERFV